MEYNGKPFPDTTGKRDDETWRDYWDRRRRERHGPGCLCLLCEMAGDNPPLPE